MPRNYNKYQYETSPRKLEPDYTPIRKRKPKKTTAKKQVSKKNKKLTKAQILKKQKVTTIKYVIIGFVILFAISYRNSQIDTNFALVQNLKQELSEVEKQNAQLEIAIENGLNLNNLEQQAKELLGMQKLSSRQTVYVSLPKTDYIEPASEEVKINDKETTFDRIINTIMNIFK